MSMPLYGVYGVSGFGREIMPLAREQLLRLGGAMDRLVFIDDHPAAEQINGHRVHSYEDFLRISASERRVIVAIADSQVRENIVNKIIDDKVFPWSVRAANSIIMDNVIIDDGAIIASFVTLTSNVRIGCQFQVNIYSYVAHDCVIGNYVTFAPGVKCNGNVVIEDHAYIGTGAILRQGKPGVPLIIGRGAIVGMGAVVTKNVPPGITVVGNPAKPLAK